MKRTPITRPGKYGRLYLYRVTYEDSPVLPGEVGYRDAYRTWAYDSEHAEQKFLSGPDADGWRIIAIERVYTT